FSLESQTGIPVIFQIECGCILRIISDPAEATSQSYPFPGACQIAILAIFQSGAGVLNRTLAERTHLAIDTFEELLRRLPRPCSVLR
ncbi:hypothetical protein, partial [Demequina salsinemoris]|uniref:hypothetical protein n=1 Tax=Demequina salsinemoris TaxID=577470 RepID=UPI001F1D82E4